MTSFIKSLINEINIIHVDDKWRRQNLLVTRLKYFKVRNSDLCYLVDVSESFTLRKKVTKFLKL